MTLPDLKLGDKGHIAAHKTIRGRVVNVLDYPSIQTAIDAAKAAGRGEVYIPDGVYPVSGTIQCATGIDLVLSHGATLKAAADVDVVRIAKRGGIRGGNIDCSQVPFTKSAILIDGNLKFYLQPTIISDIQLTGSGTGAGIHFESIQKPDGVAYPYVFGVIIDNFGVSNFERGIWMETAIVNGPDTHASVNANTISNAYINACDYAVYMVGTGGIGGNVFSNITFQPVPTNIRALVCSGEQNMFSNFFVWDWLSTGQDTAIELTGTRNIVITNRYIAYISGSETNKVITPD